MGPGPGRPTEDVLVSWPCANHQVGVWSDPAAGNCWGRSVAHDAGWSAAVPPSSPRTGRYGPCSGSVDDNRPGFMTLGRPRRDVPGYWPGHTDLVVPGGVRTGRSGTPR